MILGTLGIFHRSRVSVLVLCVSLWAIQLKQYLDPTFLKGWFLIGDPNMVRFGFIFTIGMIFYLYRDRIIVSDTMAAVSVLIVAVGMREQLYYGVGCVAWCYICMWAAVRLPFHQIDRYGDFSYGLYIYAFPVEQLFALWHVNDWGLAPYVLLSLLTAFTLAVMSWYCVERPFLRLKRVRIGKFRSTASPGDPVEEQERAHRVGASPIGRAEFPARTAAD
jgi:peptidoglycan/LPS O-acetylase OafA/YrhL